MNTDQYSNTNKTLDIYEHYVCILALLNALSIVDFTSLHFSEFKMIDGHKFCH